MDDVRNNQKIEALIRQANEHLGAEGYTEHGFRHAQLVSSISRQVLARLDYAERERELAAIAGYVHDVGNVVSRTEHGRTGAVLVAPILFELGMDPAEVATVIGAIGNHEDETGQAVNPVAAALILADKSDVHRSRVRNPDLAKFDIHDRVNYAVVRSFLNVDGARRTVTLDLTIDVKMVPVMEYFEIFLTRMMMCRRAAEFLSARFGLVINRTT
ncbi:MAG TPA: HD domain-containing protein, partial [Firmicutes bacterium]|nr:HD domain-containing protein [Bacillota bacterium]